MRPVRLHSGLLARVLCQRVLRRRYWTAVSRVRPPRCSCARERKPELIEKPARIFAWRWYSVQNCKAHTEPQHCWELRVLERCLWPAARGCACGRASEQMYRLYCAARCFPIHDAAFDGDAERLRQLLEDGVAPDRLTEGAIAQGSGQTPLHLLCQGDERVGDKPACFRLLREAGANLEALDDKNVTPLLCVLTYRTRGVEHKLNRHVRGRDTLLAMLIEAGVNVNKNALVGSTPDYYPLGSRPLHHAAKYCTKETVAALVRAGAAVNVQTGMGQTPLQVAVLSVNCRVLPTLLRAGAAIPCWCPDSDVSEYLYAIAKAGGFKKYEQNHIAKLTLTFASKFGLPAQPARLVAEYWLHAGCHDFL